MESPKANRLTVIAIDAQRKSSDFGEAVRAGLSATPKTLPCRFFYDEVGSQIFEEICELPEYYLTRAEHEILVARSADVARRFSDHTILVELGSGSSSKTRTVIEAFLRAHGRLRYVPVDISRSILEESARALLADYPGLEIVAIAAEYRQGLRRLVNEEVRRKLILWLGSSIGNFTRTEASGFLETVTAEMSVGDRLLLGVDLRKSAAVLEKAYADGAGVTARFNKNLLARINRELGGTFDLSSFDHQARYDETLGRVEMHLVSTRNQAVTISALEAQISFRIGETIHTESSYKYSFEEVTALAEAAGLRVEETWLDRRERFSLNLLAPAWSS